MGKIRNFYRPIYYCDRSRPPTIDRRELYTKDAARFPRSLGDFVVMGALLFGTGVAYKAAVGLGAGTAFLLVWVNRAVGVIGSEDNPANMLYAGVLLVGLVGTLFARLRSPP